MKHTIRKVERKDIETLVELCKAHAAFEGSGYSTANKVSDLSDHLFSKSPVLECLVVEMDKQLVGYATFMKQFSTWDAAFYVYMDCIYLEKATRGKGIGKELLNKVAQYARSQNCSLIQWQTPTANTRAIKFYREYGANSKMKERFFLDLG
ncbi:MAG: GNAT family N-acetyltransferase [Cyclobacteriaceae bacterium]